MNPISHGNATDLFPFMSQQAWLCLRENGAYGYFGIDHIAKKLVLAFRGTTRESMHSIVADVKVMCNFVER
jgi:hypothetical protein